MTGKGAGPLTGFGVFVRTFARRDRWLVLWFLIGNTLLYWSQAVSVDGLYKTQAEFDRAAASEAANTAFVAMAGPARALDTTGGQVTWQASAFGAIVVGLLNMVLVLRHTRAEEESGRDELVRASVVGRCAPMTAALVVAVVADALLGLGVALSLILYGLPSAGAWSLGVGLWAVGVAFAAVALLAAQLTESTRAAYGIVGAVIGAAYAVRAVGDVSGHGLSWVSPIGWYQAMHAYSGERWWPALLPIALACAVLLGAYRLFEQRDFGSGPWAARPGPAHAPATLHGQFGLALRLQRGGLVGWSLGMLVLGLGYGSIGDDVGTLTGDSSFSHDIFGVGRASLVDGFYAAAALMLVLVAAGFTISSALRPHAEEESGRVEPLLATALTRRRWMLGHLSVTMLGTVLAVTLAGLGMGVGYALSTGDGSAIWRFAGASDALLPGALVLGAVARLLTGVLPRWATLAWVGLGYCVFVMFFGELLRLPGWLRGISPFHHLAQVPAQSFDVASYVVVSAGAVVLAAIGVLAFERRDVH